MKISKRYLFALAGLLVAVGLLYGLYLIAQPKSEAGSKHITVTVVGKDGSAQSTELITNDLYLSDVLLKNALVECTGTGSSMYVISAGGTAADEAAQEWWGLSVDGEMAMTGIADTPIEDGKEYTLTLNVGW